MINMRPRRRSGRAGGFTLVELLVVVSIIALLISILLPSLSRARDSAKSLKCATSVRGICQAGLTYATDDPQEFGIPINEADQLNGESWRAPYSPGGKSGTGVTGIVSQSLFSGAKGQGSADRLLNRVIYNKAEFRRPAGGGGPYVTADWTFDTQENLPIFSCPGDRGFPGMHMQGWKDNKTTTSYDYFGTAYNANVYLIGQNGIGATVASNSPYRRSLSRVPNAPNTILYMENAARYAAYATNSELRQVGCFWPYAYGDFIARGNHKKNWKFNVAFCDGSARNIKIKGHAIVDYAAGKIPSNLTCILLRGNDWQFDTMPSPPLDTNKIRSADINGHVQQDGSSGEFVVVR